ncbi:MAG: carboxylating nicotinate-nucleotide diphosphorylase [Clostridia bacterium]|nr:carboxylating nicotinate-nucleotide diphosphorylase [Clostridia bacterium]
MLFDQIDKLIETALREDISNGDITTDAIFDKDAKAHGKYIAKEDGVICGIDVVKRVFEILGGEFEFTPNFKDGDKVKKGDVIAKIKGDARTLLSGERVGLNLLQHLSGIATATSLAVEAVSGTDTKISDTRKTTPGLRLLEKYAVKVGGGSNHRFCLADGVLIKDNHISACGSITKAVEKAKRSVPHTVKIEVEVESLDEVREALAAGADIIMLDNMSNELMAEAVKIIDKKAITEASGNMGQKNLFEVAKTGVDIISIGALTHSVRAMDISLKFKV